MLDMEDYSTSICGLFSYKTTFKQFVNKQFLEIGNHDNNNGSLWGFFGLRTHKEIEIFVNILKYKSHVV